MNVIQVAHRYRPAIGGLENYIYRLENSLHLHGHSTDVITTDASLDNEKSPLPRESAKYCRTNVNIFRNPVSVELYRRLKRIEGDVYHLHSPWYLTTLEAVHAAPADRPKVMTIHGVLYTESFFRERLVNRLLGIAYKPFARYVLDRVDRIIVLGESERVRLQQYFDVPSRKISVIPNGIHPDECDVSRSAVDEFHREYGVDPATPTILFVGRLVPLKRAHVLVDVVSNHFPDTELDVIIIGTGDEEYVSKLRSKADSRVRILSNLSYEKVLAAHHSSDIFVLLSTIEGLPTVVLEAMNARLPIVATDVGAVPDVVEHRTNGRILDASLDEAALAEAIQFYVENDREREKVGRRNRKRVRKHFDWSDVAEDIESLYRELRADRPRDRQRVR